jgi:molybdenum cofactor cytidylyltransferase
MIHAVVLAAGLSSRMGSQKVVLPYGGSTVVGHIADELLAGAVDGVLVVVGHEAERVREALGARRVAVVENPDYRAGMLSSVRCGLRALPDGCEAVLLALGDQPAVTSELVDTMIRSHAATGKGIVVPVCGERRGHPVLFSIRYRDEVLSRFDDVGLRGLLRTHPGDVFELNTPNSAILSDMDRPEDYDRALARLECDGRE